MMQSEHTQKLERIQQLLMPDTGRSEYVYTEGTERPYTSQPCTEHIVSENNIWAGKIFSVKTLDVELPDHTHGYREIVKHHGGAAVVALRAREDTYGAATHNDGATDGISKDLLDATAFGSDVFNEFLYELCLVRQYRVALGRPTLELPAGKLEDGEAPEVCAARELQEETGLCAERLVHLASCVGSPGFSNEKTEVFFAEGLSEGSISLDEGEVLSSLWLPLDEVLAAIDEGLIQDAKTIVGVLTATRLLENGQNSEYPKTDNR